MKTNMYRFPKILIALLIVLIGVTIIMDLQSLGLDRNLYRDPSDNPSYVNSDYQQYLNANGPGQTGVTDISNPLGQGPGSPGSTVSNSIVRSSPGPNRIEIDPVAPQGIGYDNVDDMFISYINSQPGVLIFQDQVIAKHGVFTDLGVSTVINYGPHGIHIPYTYLGAVTSTGTISGAYALSWTCVHTSTGVYTITHGLGLTSPYFTVLTNVIMTGTPLVASATQTDGNTFVVKVFNSETGAATDAGFTFSAQYVL